MVEGALTSVERESAWRDFAFDAETGMLVRREPQVDLNADAAAAQADADGEHLQSLLDRLLAKQPVDQADPLAAELRTALHEARDAAAIDDDPARRRRLEEALAQFDAWQAGSQAALERMQAALAAPAAEAAVAAVAAPAASDAQSIDAELLEIFLFEADEVLTGVRTDLQALHVTAQAGSGGAATGSDLDLLTQLRRAFHTLKGSGRMVGLTRYGEAAWAIEQVMNVWLAESRVPTPDLAALLARAEADLSAWTAAIAQAPHADHAIEPLVAAADRVRHGGPFVWLEAVADVPAPQSLEAPAEPAVSPEPAAPAPEPWLHVVEPVDTPADAPVAPEAPFAPVEPVLQANDAASLSWDDVPVLPASDALAAEAPVLAPVSEPVAEAVTAPEPISEPMVEPIAEPVVEPAAIEPVAEAAAAEPAPAEADAKVIPFPFEQTGTPEEASHDDGIKIIGPVYISVALYNVYLQEADALIRRLGVDFSNGGTKAAPSRASWRCAPRIRCRAAPPWWSSSRCD